MVKALRTIAVFGAAALLAGCGGSATSSSSSSSDNSGLVASIATSLVADNGGTLGLTQANATCVAQGFVDKFGVQGLQDMGLLDANLTPVSGSAPAMTADQASTAADVMLSCIDSKAFLTGLMSGAGIDQTVLDCITSQLGDQGMHDLLVAVFSEDQTKLQATLLPLMGSCAVAPS